jgi:O-antigen biosynthesis protein
MNVPADNRYWVKVDAEAQNNAHAFAIELIGQNKKVLELGPAAGHVTRVLVRRGCTVTGIEADADAAAGLEGVATCIVGDLSDPSVVRKAAEEEKFDVVLAGDVLEHLPDPLSTLRACREVLAPGGFVIVSLPNVGHADIALSLLQGEFPYGEYGLLDRTHLRFFTLPTVHDLLEQAGLIPIDIRRVVRPIFETELGLDRSAFSPDIIESVLANPEAETYQFVVRAVPHNGDHEVSQLAKRTIDSYEELRHERAKRLSAEAELAAVKEATRKSLLDADSKLSALRAELRAANTEADKLRQAVATKTRKVDALLSSKTWRYTAPTRAVYRAIRSAIR